jgi:pimeloyl-ACP methyl ester carboxylesterase
VVGSSVGAYAAVHFGLMYLELARWLVVAGVGTGSPAANRAAWVADCEANARAYLEQDSRAWTKLPGRTPTRIHLLHKTPRCIRGIVAHLREDSAKGKAKLSGLGIPVLLIAGNEDESCLETALWLQRRLPNAGLWICPNSGHAVNLEDPAAFNRTVEDFLNAVRAHY